MNKTYSQRASYALNPMAIKLLKLMDEKKTNLAISADVITSSELLALADSLGPHIALFKTHIDILRDFTPTLPYQLKALAEKHRFLIFEDRKFADIGHTVSLQYREGLYQIAEWADIVNAHILPGPGIIESLKEVGLQKNRALLLLAEMSSKENLAKGAYTQKSIEWAKMHEDFVIGFICQRKLCDDPALLHLTPGVHLASASDPLGQQYISPQEAIFEKGSDLLIVGRGILQAPDPLVACQTYQQAGWQAYLKRVEGHP